MKTEAVVDSETLVLSAKLHGVTPKKKDIFVVTGRTLLLILQSFDWLAAFNLELLQAILFVAL